MSTFPAVFFQFLEDTDDPSLFLVDPEIEAGDFQISNGGGPFVNLQILPVVEPAGTPQVKFALTDNERSNPGALIYGKDQSGDQWREIVFTPSDCTPETTNTIVVGGMAASGKVAAVKGRGAVERTEGSGRVSRVSGGGGPRISGGSASSKIIAR